MRMVGSCTAPIQQLQDVLGHLPTYDRTSINSWEDTAFKKAVDAVGGTSLAAHEAALRRIEQAGAKLISRVQMYCELQRDWAREATVPGFMGVFDNFDGFNVEKEAGKAAKAR